MDSGQETFEDYFDNLDAYQQAYYEDELAGTIGTLYDEANLYLSPQRSSPPSAVSSPSATAYFGSVAPSQNDYAPQLYEYNDIGNSSTTRSNVELSREFVNNDATFLSRYDNPVNVPRAPTATTTSGGRHGMQRSSGRAASSPIGVKSVGTFVPLQGLSAYQEYRQIRHATNSEQPRLVLTSALPHTYTSLFPFDVFNAVQSACFPSVFRSQENVVVSAPTGSGKTVIFELAIVKMLINSPQGDSKCIYIAPTKALCAEKCRQWSEKYEPIGVKCFELTGDTASYGKGAWADAKNARIILTTPEKLDSLSRNWNDHQSMFESIDLLCVDEVHILGEERGNTLEAGLSRMKMRAKSRFILVSATVPNASDIATWIGPRDGGESAICLKFGNEYRPCTLTQHVQGYRRNNASSFQFDRTLDGKVFGALQKYCDAKPTLIFCATRKGAVATAQRIVKDYKEMQTKHAVLPWKPIKQEWPKMHSDLVELVSFGVAIHHAGLSPEDRRLIEDRFLTGKLFIVVATSTLAVGVNLPCRTVIIKGVELWDGSKTREYSDLDVLQMMGRAGRPQFDKEGVAVILCDLEQRQKYEKLTQASTVIESSLHLSLAEHLNSEIVLGTVGDVKSGREWIKNTFFYRRIQANPVYYGFLSGIPAGGWEAYFDNLVEQTLANLTSSQMIEYKEGLVNATAFGNLASRLYVKQPSMKLIIEIPELATKKDVLLALSQADEYKEVRLRQGERSVYNKLCQHSDIRFGLKKVERAHEKVYILLQAILGNISLGATEYQNRDSILPLEATRVYKHAIRLMSCVIEAAVSRGAGSLLKTSLELYRSLKAKGWEDRPTVLRQLEGIGEKAMQIFGMHGITSLDKFANLKPHQIDTWLNRKAPFGKKTLSMVNSLPRFTLSVEEVDTKPSKDGKTPVIVSLQIGCSATCEEETGSKTKTPFGTASVLTCLSTGELVDYRRITVRALLREEKFFTVVVNLSKPSEVIEVHISPNDIAGLARTLSYKPFLSPDQYPVPDTRPVLKEEKEEIIDISSHNNSDNNLYRMRSGAGNHSAKTRPTNGVQTLSNGNYACNHRCKDKKDCHHRCCKEGLAKPPVVRKAPSIKSFAPAAHSKVNTNLEASDTSTHPVSLLNAFNSFHDQIETKTTFSDSSRVTMKPKSFGAEANSSGDDSDELDKLLRDSVKKKHGGQVKKPQASQDGFSDTEMEDVMAAVPLSILKSQQAVPGITEKRKRESDEGPPRKRRRPGHSLEPQPNFRSEEAITEIDLSLCSLSPALTYSELIHPSSRLDAHTGKDKVTHVGRPNQGLFLPASSDDVQWHVDKKETESNQKTTTLPWSDDDPWKFELDPNIFERGTGILAPLGVEKNRGIKDVEQQPLIDKGQNMSNQQEVRSSQENLLKELDDDALFEMLIKGISTV